MLYYKKKAYAMLVCLKFGKFPEYMNHSCFANGLPDTLINSKALVVCGCCRLLYLVAGSFWWWFSVNFVNSHHPCRCM